MEIRKGFGVSNWNYLLRERFLFMICGWEGKGGGGVSLSTLYQFVLKTKFSVMIFFSP